MLVEKNKYIKELQKVELYILKMFHKFCNDNNLEYYMAYGTLLGAVRHQGFIPWDDDVDVFMKGKDFLKIQELFNKDKNNSKYFLQSLKSEKNYYLLWNKIRLNNTLFVEKGWEKNNINNGIFIDIFPLIDCPKNKLLDKWIRIKVKFLHLLIEENIKNNPKCEKYGKAGKILSKILKYVPQKLRNKLVIREMKKLCQYESDGEYYYTIDEGKWCKFPKKDFEDKILLSFENEKFYSPKGYENNLKLCYGDYMKLPKEEDRIGHGEVYLNLEDTSDEE